MSQALQEDYIWRTNEEEVLRYFDYFGWSTSTVIEKFRLKHKMYVDNDWETINAETVSKQIKSGVFNVQGHDKDGRANMYIFFKRVNPKKFTQKEFNRYLIYISEYHVS